MRNLIASSLLLALVLVATPRSAFAQYKNTSFGLDVGGWFINKPTVVEDDGKTIKSRDNRPLRLGTGLRLGGESNFKMNDDHYWFVGRVNVGFLQFPKGEKNNNPQGDAEINDAYDYAAGKAMGTLLGVEGSIGVRYVFLTDRVRPYLQFAMSYLRLMSFADSSNCDDSELCGDTSNGADFLTHPNVGGVHLQPGLEMVFTRDIALHFYIDLQRWIIFNADDNNAAVVGVGMVFFT